MKIVIDTREQAPFSFCNYPVEVVQGALQSGDYSLHGCESLVAVERKSLADLTGCLGRDRDRFQRELERLRGYEAAAVVCEEPFADLMAGCYRSKIPVSTAYESMVALMCRNKLTFHFALNRDGAERFVFSFLKHFANGVERRYKAVVSQPKKQKISIESMAG